MNWEKLLCPLRPGEHLTSGKQEETRSIFEQDFDRIVFSYPFRCLQDKTQVFPLPKTEFVHTRLTHSLEVSSVGRSLGKRAGKVIRERYPETVDPGLDEFGAIVAAASLAHDIGNPPFGHSGEDAISDYFLRDPFGSGLKSRFTPQEWADLSSFEGNAQGFRLLTRNNYQGLRITHATLAAFSKYPRESFLPEKDPQRRSHKKFGFFQSEKEKFIDTAYQTGMTPLTSGHLSWIRHPLAFLVEAADDICYSIIDLEDGCNLGLISMNTTEELLAPISGRRFDKARFDLMDDTKEKAGLLRALAITGLVEQVSSAFLDLEKEMLSGTFDKALTSVIPAEKYLKDIISLSMEKIYRSIPVAEKEAAGFEVLTGLIDAFIKAAQDHHASQGRPGRKNETIINLFPLELKKILVDNSASFYEIVMGCLDYLTLMTDSLALETFRKIKGIALPGM